MAEVLLAENNPLLKQVRRAVSRGSLTADGCAVAEGLHLLGEAIESGCEIRAVIVSESTVFKHSEKLRRVRVMTVSDSTFAGLASTETPQGVIALVKPPEWTLDRLFEGRALVAVLDGVQDPGNAGAILRAAEAFGATGAALLKGSVSAYNPKCIRASAGSVFRLPLVAGLATNVFSEAIERNRVRLYAAMPRADLPASRADLVGPCAIVIGSEGKGVSAELQTRATGLRIPTSRVESLNAAVAAGVLLYEAQRQRTAL